MKVSLGLSPLPVGEADATKLQRVRAARRQGGLGDFGGLKSHERQRAVSSCVAKRHRFAPSSRSLTVAVLSRSARAVCVFAALFCSSPLVAKETLVKNVAEFDAAVRTAEPGDEIILVDGKWRDADLVFRGEGAPGRPIVVRAQTPGQAILLGASRLRFGGQFLKASGLFWKVPSAKDDVISFCIDSKTLAESCELSDCAIVDDSSVEGERKWVSLYGRDHLIRNCRFEGKRSPGTLLVVWLDDNQPRHKITLNFFGPRSTLGKNGGEIMRIGDSDTSLQEAGAEVLSNYFYRCSGEAEIVSNKSCGNVYANNVFVGCGGALTLRHGNRCRVESNTFFGDRIQGTGGVRVIGEDHEVVMNLFHELTGDNARAALSIMNGIPASPLNGHVQVRRAMIVNNYFINCKETVSLGLSDKDRSDQTLPPLDCVLGDNVVTARGKPIFTVHTPAPTTKYASNLYTGAKLGIDENPGWKLLDAEELHEAVLQQDRIRPAVPPGDVGPSGCGPTKIFCLKY